MKNEIEITLPPVGEGQTDWKLYSEYQSPIGRDPWPLGDRIMWRVLMFLHGWAEKLWHLIWNLAQPFARPPMRYETKYHEIKVIEKHGNNLTVRGGSHLTNGMPVFSEKPK